MKRKSIITGIVKYIQMTIFKHLIFLLIKKFLIYCFVSIFCIFLHFINLRIKKNTFQNTNFENKNIPS